MSLGFMLSQCDQKSDSTIGIAHSNPVWRNHADSVQYVGKEVCQTCHSEIAHSFSHTGMGSSFNHASIEKAHVHWNGSIVIYDEQSNLGYIPFFRGDILMVKEFRIEHGDTVHQRIQKVDYIIGSGQHTNSHIISINGFLYQAPFTFYTQKGKADLPPGFEHGNNSRFSRQIGLECMSCHNAMPTEFVLGSTNRFNSVPKGIDCERCHGPGEIHVNDKLSGRIVDTAVHADYSIVNPRRLTADRQVEICQRCHLQGNAVLHEGKSFFDFKPGMILSDYMDVYLPRYTDSKDNFIMASHVDRFKQSKCFQSSNNAFNCISCHNPHVSVVETKNDLFNAQCVSCHQEDHASSICSESRQIRDQNADNCVACHMPSSSSEDIPHVSVHDHWIRKPQVVEPTEVERKLQALVAINNPQPSIISKANAFLQQFEQFNGTPEMLDSALFYIQKLPSEQAFREWIHLYYLKGTFGLLARYVESVGAQKLLNRLNSKSYNNADAWSMYRIGEAYNSLDQVNQARTFYKQALDLAPNILEFENKFGALALKMGDIQTAESSFQRLLELNPYLPEAHGNYGYVQLLYGDTSAAMGEFQAAIDLNPDYEPARLNLVSCYLAKKEWKAAKDCFQPIYIRNPNNGKYKSVWIQINEAERVH